MGKIAKLTSDFPVPVGPRMTTIGADGGLRVDILATHLMGNLCRRRRGTSRVLIMECSLWNAQAL